MLDRVKASYARLAIERPEKPPRVVRVKHCQLCAEPAWSDGLCAEHLVERGRAITTARQQARRIARRKQFFLAKRDARQSGDMQLWSEIEWRRRRGTELPQDTSPTALWRKKWSTK
jgi:hypothetical protein